MQVRQHIGVATMPKDIPRHGKHPSAPPRRISSQPELPPAAPSSVRGEGERTSKAREDPSSRGTKSMLPPPEVRQPSRKRKSVRRPLSEDEEDEEVNIASQSSHEQSWRYDFLHSSAHKGRQNCILCCHSRLLFELSVHAVFRLMSIVTTDVISDSRVSKERPVTTPLHRFNMKVLPNFKSLGK